MSEFSGKRWHDMGGNPAGSVDAQEHDYALWEKRVDALEVITTKKGYFTVDALRRCLEDMGEAAFDQMSYYERWIAAVNQNLLEQDVYSIQDLAEKMAEVRARGPTYGDCGEGGND